MVALCTSIWLSESRAAGGREGGGSVAQLMHVSSSSFWERTLPERKGMGGREGAKEGKPKIEGDAKKYEQEEDK